METKQCPSVTPLSLYVWRNASRWNVFLMGEDVGIFGGLRNSVECSKNRSRTCSTVRFEVHLVAAGADRTSSNHWYDLHGLLMCHGQYRQPTAKTRLVVWSGQWPFDALVMELILQPTLQSSESWLTHIPGLELWLPGTPGMKGLLGLSVVITLVIILSMSEFNKKGSTSWSSNHSMESGIKREGTDVKVVTEKCSVVWFKLLKN